MSEYINNYAFAKSIDQFKIKVLDPQQKKLDEAFKIITDLQYPWKDADHKKRGQIQFESYKAWLDFYKAHYEEGRKLVNQHERLVDALSKWYDNWYSNISNEGRQESQIMEIQADMLQEIFVEIYKVLEPLNLDIKQPKALNL